MPNSNKLSIYLIKDEFANDDDKILKEDKELLADIDDVGKVYYKRSDANVPKWVSSFFCDKVDGSNIFTSNARAVLITRVSVDEKEKTFAISLGYGKFLFADDVIEDDFGLKVVLNTIEPNGLRRINKVNVGGNQKSSNEQLPLEANIEAFGFDVDRDLIGTITGVSKDKSFVEGTISGGELLSLTAPVDITNVKEFLKKAYKRYDSKQYRDNFGWIDHIKKVKDSRLIEALDSEMVRLINEESANIWMAVPEVINWEDVSGFRYKGREVHSDIYISVVRDSFRNGLTNVKQLKDKQILAISAQNENDVCAIWQAYKCIFGEVEYEGKAYCINNGRWFCVDKDFVNGVNADYERIPISDMSFLRCTSEHDTENKYTVAFVNSDPEHLLCLDAKTIYYGGGKSQIELCDILTTDNTYIHIKPYSGSSTLSHLFNQAVVSAELVLGDSEFRAKANLKIKELSENEEFLIDGKNRPNVILAIISDKSEVRPKIPFFSKVALRYAKRRLETYGCTLKIKNIEKHVDLKDG